MPKFKMIIYVLLGAFLITSVKAAIIYGTIYDLSLKKINSARVEINTSPKQFLISQNGSYAVNVPNGAYTIKAQLIQKNDVLASVEENITIKQEGTYVLDLILFPNIEEGVEDINIDINEDILQLRNNFSNVFIILGILLILSIIFVGLFYFIKHKKTKKIKNTKKIAKPFFLYKKEENTYGDNYLDKIVNILGQEGGRTTQKEIRKQIPLSEAKISLMIAELEHKGVIEKIKKGRGNIIILKQTKHLYKIANQS